MAAKTNRKPPLVSEPGVEIIDAAGNTLLVMPREQALRQRLRHRLVLVCLRNTRGGIFLHKKISAGDGGETWFPAVHDLVLAGESRHDAAVRLLGAELGISGLEVSEAARFTQPPSGPAGNVETTLFLTAKTSALPRLPEPENQGGMFVDQEEFKAILRDYPHMLPPLWSLALPYFFSG